MGITEVEPTPMSSGVDRDSNSDVLSEIDGTLESDVAELRQRLLELAQFEGDINLSAEDKAVARELALEAIYASKKLTLSLECLFEQIDTQAVQD